MNKLGHQNIRMVDSSHKVSMSGKNLLNLTQSAEAREEKQDAEKYSSQKLRTANNDYAQNESKKIPYWIKTESYGEGININGRPLSGNKHKLQNRATSASVRNQQQKRNGDPSSKYEITGN
jgi:hypothetical protein